MRLEQRKMKSENQDPAARLFWRWFNIHTYPIITRGNLDKPARKVKDTPICGDTLAAIRHARKP